MASPAYLGIKWPFMYSLTHLVFSSTDKVLDKFTDGTKKSLVQKFESTRQKSQVKNTVKASLH